MAWFCSGAGVLVPGYAFFTAFPPPIFPGISLLTCALSAATIYISLHINSGNSQNKSTCPHLLRNAIFLLITAFCSLMAYVLLLRYCTVLDPQSYTHRFQVGFWKFDWSLTEIGISLKQKMRYAPIEDWMLREGSFTQGGPETIWLAWSITAAGCAMVLTYISGFVLWTAGFAALARHQYESANRLKTSKSEKGKVRGQPLIMESLGNSQPDKITRPKNGG